MIFLQLTIVTHVLSTQSSPWQRSLRVLRVLRGSIRDAQITTSSRESNAPQTSQPPPHDRVGPASLRVPHHARRWPPDWKIGMPGPRSRGTVEAEAGREGGEGRGDSGSAAAGHGLGEEAVDGAGEGGAGALQEDDDGGGEVGGVFGVAHTHDAVAEQVAPCALDGQGGGGGEEEERLELLLEGLDEVADGDVVGEGVAEGVILRPVNAAITRPSGRPAARRWRAAGTPRSRAPAACRGPRSPSIGRPTSSCAG
jgi:hypothetical protein